MTSFKSKQAKQENFERTSISMQSGIKNTDLHEKVLVFGPLLKRVFSPSHTRKKNLTKLQDCLTGFDPAAHQRT